MKKPLSLLVLLSTTAAVYYYFAPRYTYPHLPQPSIAQSKKPEKKELQKLQDKALSLKKFASANGYCTSYCFLIDMSLHSGRNRFFIYDLNNNKIAKEGLVAHGSCNSNYLEEASFSNVSGDGCSSTGRYKVGYAYEGRFGTAYKLYGLDSSNSNAFKRNVVLHAYGCVPDSETYPQSLCNSLGCPMVSYSFLETASKYIKQSRKPVLLWVFE